MLPDIIRQYHILGSYIILEALPTTTTTIHVELGDGQHVMVLAIGTTHSKESPFYGFI